MRREQEGLRWLQLTYKVPSEPSQKRVWVWRKLQNLGAYALQNSVYLLPYSEDVEKRFRQLANDIRAMGGEASIFALTALDAADEQRIIDSLIETRAQDYQSIITLCHRFVQQVAQLISTNTYDEGAQEQLTAALENIHTQLRKVRRRDLMGALTANNRANAAEALASCEQLYRVVLDKDFSRARRLLEDHTDAGD